MNFYGKIQKVDNENRMVYGYASTEAKDNTGETVLKSAVEAALADYMEYANIRQMHSLSAVGTAEEASTDDKGLYIGAKIIDDAAWAKVVSGVYKGFSIGGKVLARGPEDMKIITKIQLNEISLVDRPSNPEARFDVWKAAGAEREDLEPEFLTKTETDIRAAVAAELSKALADAELAKTAATEASALADGLAKSLGERDDALAKIAERFDPLLKAVEDLRAANVDLSKRLAAVEESAVPAKTAGVHALSKGDDAGGSPRGEPQNEDDLVKALAAMTEEDRALSLIKAAHQLPHRIAYR